MTECTGGTVWSTNNTQRWGSIGCTHPGHEVRVFQCEEKILSNGEKVTIKIPCPPTKDLNSPFVG